MNRLKISIMENIVSKRKALLNALEEMKILKQRISDLKLEIVQLNKEKMSNAQLVALRKAHAGRKAGIEARREMNLSGSDLVK